MTFDAELAALARGAWQFYAPVDDLANDHDYVRKTVFGVDIFVQRFGGELRGYRNVCAHRGFPIRREARGNGPVQCGFHGWVYNRDGVPHGVPRNAELFGLSRDDQRKLALDEIRVEVLGRFVFVAIGQGAPPLAEYLGEYAHVLAAVSANARELRFRDASTSAATWKTCFEITLDDYHIQAVHPTTFGSGEPAPAYKFFYGREGLHSHCFRRRDADWSFDGYWADVRRGVVDFTGYKILQVFPNLLVAIAPPTLVMSLYTPIDARSTMVEHYLFDWKHDPLDEASAAAFARTYMHVVGEDQAICEQLDAGAGQPRRPDVLGKLEQRIAWYREAFAAFMGSA